MTISRIARKELEEALAEWPALLRVKEAAEVGRVHERTIRRALSDGRLAATSVGTRTYLIPKAALIAFLCRGVS
ncbi:helix-turn-helix domain-containing protein [Planctomycetota bacterium]|nr:helix-turn-helix domain-containing protein [Planctomycetota bacterium]